MWIRNIILGALLLLGCAETRADDALAQQMVQDVREQYDPDNMSSQEYAFEMLYIAYGTADSYSVKQEISEELLRVYRNYTNFVKYRVAPFLDSYDENKDSLYSKLANYKDLRGKYFHGIALLMDAGKRQNAQDAKSAMVMISQCAADGYAPAAYLMSGACALGMEGLGVARNETYAYRWLVMAAEGNYAPAYEKLAAIHWDADGNYAAKWDQAAAIEYLDKAIALYSEFSNLSDSDERAELAAYIRSLQLIRAHMVSFKGYRTGDIMSGFYPTFLALRLSTFSEGESGLRSRAYYIVQAMNYYPGTFHLGNLPNLDLSLIPIRLSANDPDVGGYMVPYYPSNDTLSLKVDVHVENYAYGNDEASHWKREISINSTIAHEFAHCFLAGRYRSVFSQFYPYYEYVVEGHATHAQYAFSNYYYFNSAMTSETFATSWLSSKYAGYFRWYRNNCLLPNGSTDWSVIEQHERSASPTGEGGKNRKLISGPSGTFKAPIFFR